MKITTILNEVLRPLGFNRSGKSWLYYVKPVLVRVSFYKSQWGGPGYIDVALTVSEIPIVQQRTGDWDALARLTELIPSGHIIDEKIFEEMGEQDGEIVRKILTEQGARALESLCDPATALWISQEQNGWSKRGTLKTKLAALSQKD